MSVQVLWDADAETKPKVQEIYWGRGGAGKYVGQRSWSRRERDSDYGFRSDTHDGWQRRKVRDKYAALRKPWPSRWEAPEPSSRTPDIYCQHGEARPGRNSGRDLEVAAARGCRLTGPFIAGSLLKTALKGTLPGLPHNLICQLTPTNDDDNKFSAHLKPSASSSNRE